MSTVNYELDDLNQHPVWQRTAAEEFINTLTHGLGLRAGRVGRAGDGVERFAAWRRVARCRLRNLRGQPRGGVRGFDAVAQLHERALEEFFPPARSRLHLLS